MGMTLEEYESNDLMAENEFLRKQLAEALKHRRMFEADYENRLKADLVAMLRELKYDLYYELCKEIHGKEDCPCVGQTISCLATFRVCDANRAIDKVIQQKINELKAESGVRNEIN